MMRWAISWVLYHTGYALLVLSERLQGSGPGPWGEVEPIGLSGNQFFDAEFRLDE